MVAKFKEAVLAIPSPEVIVCCEEVFVGQNIARSLARGGLDDVEVVNAGQLKTLLSFGFTAQLVLVYNHEDMNSFGGLETVKALREACFDRMIGLITPDPYIEEVIAAFRLGADDVLVRGNSCDLKMETLDLLSRAYARPKGSFWNHDIISELSLFRTAGLSEGQIEVLHEFAKEFATQREIAEAQGKTELQVRKTFSRMYEKLGPLFGIRNIAQLSRLVSVCVTCVNTAR